METQEKLPTSTKSQYYTTSIPNRLEERNITTFSLKHFKTFESIHNYKKTTSAINLTYNSKFINLLYNIKKTFPIITLGQKIESNFKSATDAIKPKTSKPTKSINNKKDHTTEDINKLKTKTNISSTTFFAPKKPFVMMQTEQEIFQSQIYPVMHNSKRARLIKSTQLTKNLFSESVTSSYIVTSKTRSSDKQNITALITKSTSEYIQTNARNITKITSCRTLKHLELTASVQPERNKSGDLINKKTQNQFENKFIFEFVPKMFANETTLKANTYKQNINALHSTQLSVTQQETNAKTTKSIETPSFVIYFQQSGSGEIIQSQMPTSFYHIVDQTKTQINVISKRLLTDITRKALSPKSNITFITTTDNNRHYIKSTSDKQNKTATDNHTITSELPSNKSINASTPKSITYKQNTITFCSPSFSVKRQETKTVTTNSIETSAFVINIEQSGSGEIIQSQKPLSNYSVVDPTKTNTNVITKQLFTTTTEQTSLLRFSITFIPTINHTTIQQSKLCSDNQCKIAAITAQQNANYVSINPMTTSTLQSLSKHLPSTEHAEQQQQSGDFVTHENQRIIINNTEQLFSTTTSEVYKTTIVFKLSTNKLIPLKFNSVTTDSVKITIVSIKASKKHMPIVLTTFTMQNLTSIWAVEPTKSTKQLELELSEKSINNLTLFNQLSTKSSKNKMDLSTSTFAFKFMPNKVINETTTKYGTYEQNKTIWHSSQSSEGNRTDINTIMSTVTKSTMSKMTFALTANNTVQQTISTSCKENESIEKNSIVGFTLQSNKSFVATTLESNLSNEMRNRYQLLNISHSTQSNIKQQEIITMVTLSIKTSLIAITIKQTSLETPTLIGDIVGLTRTHMNVRTKQLLTPKTQIPSLRKSNFTFLSTADDAIKPTKQTSDKRHKTMENFNFATITPSSKSMDEIISKSNTYKQNLTRLNSTQLRVTLEEINAITVTSVGTRSIVDTIQQTETVHDVISQTSAHTDLDSTKTPTNVIQTTEQFSLILTSRFRIESTKILKKNFSPYNLITKKNINNQTSLQSTLKSILTTDYVNIKTKVAFTLITVTPPHLYAFQNTTTLNKNVSKFARTEKSISTHSWKINTLTKEKDVAIFTASIKNDLTLHPTLVEKGKNILCVYS